MLICMHRHAHYYMGIHSSVSGGKSLRAHDQPVLTPYHRLRIKESAMKSQCHSAVRSFCKKWTNSCFTYRLVDWKSLYCLSSRRQTEGESSSQI